MKLSVVIPAHNEEGCIESTVRALYETLKKAGIDHEILVINDNSNDSTQGILERLLKEIETLNVVVNRPPNGFGFAVRRGLEEFSGDAVCIFMADASDDPNDVVKYYHLLIGNGVDCMFGSRFMKGGKVIDYPLPKLVMNRMANVFVQSLFGLRFNDVTNAFKMYRREVIEGAQPLMSHHFNLTVELPLKAIVRGFSYAAMPISWTNRKTGVSKLKIQEMGSRYLFIVIYCFIEKWLSRGDYRRSRRPDVNTRVATEPHVTH
jgi:dolichol-phosphate mannosyltransferase